jgi:hypothetical protein
VSFPAKDGCLKDRRLSRVDILIYAVLCDELDFRQPRPVKRGWVAHATKVNRANVQRSVRRLVALSYLEPAGRETGHHGRCLYRLVYSVSGVTPQSAA